jgi:hypothetical protein
MMAFVILITWSFDMMHARTAIPGREYPKGEIMNFVVNPFWQQMGETREVRKGEVVCMLGGGSVLIKEIEVR